MWQQGMGEWKFLEGSQGRAWARGTSREGMGQSWGYGLEGHPWRRGQTRHQAGGPLCR